MEGVEQGVSWVAAVCLLATSRLVERSAFMRCCRRGLRGQGDEEEEVVVVAGERRLLRRLTIKKEGEILSDGQVGVIQGVCLIVRRVRAGVDVNKSELNEQRECLCVFVKDEKKNKKKVKSGGGE